MNPHSAARSLSLLLLASMPCTPVRADEANGIRSSVAPVGDLDGDGVPDFALVHRGAGPKWSFHGGAVSAGKAADKARLLVWILSGHDGSRIRRLDPPAECVGFGRVMEDVGDVDGDGVRDLAIAGGEHVWIFSGADGHVVHELGKDLDSPGFCQSLAGGRDVDGDGVPDVAVLRRSRTREAPTMVLVYSGRSAELVRAFGCRATVERPQLAEGVYSRVPGVALTGAIALVPDSTGDGHAEIALSSGGVQLGADGAAVEALLVLDTTDARVLQASTLPERQSGGDPWVIRSLGDLDGDGALELAISLVHDYLVVYRGGSGEELRRHSFVGYYMNAEGTSLDAIGDVDGDGVSDYVLGANEDSLDCDPGFAIVYSGKDGAPIRNLQFDYYDNNCGAGVDVCTLGDANGDGVDDVVVHMPRLQEARVLSGADFSVLTRVDVEELAQAEASKR